MFFLQPEVSARNPNVGHDTPVENCISKYYIYSKIIYGKMQAYIFLWRYVSEKLNSSPPGNPGLWEKAIWVSSNWNSSNLRMGE